MLGDYNTHCVPNYNTGGYDCTQSMTGNVAALVPQRQDTPIDVLALSMFAVIFVATGVLIIGIIHRIIIS